MEKEADARQVILQAAISTFARKGYAGTSVQDILAGSDLSKPTLYYYFESKAGLFKAILDSAYDGSYELMCAEVARRTSCEEKLIAASTALFEFTRKNKDLTRLVFATVFAAPEELPPQSVDLSKRRRAFELFRDILSDGQKKGEVADDYDVLDLTHGLFGAVTHRIRTYLLTSKEIVNKECARKTVALFLRGAGPCH
jgi:AcrR family transcriptional regulator